MQIREDKPNIYAYFTFHLKYGNEKDLYIKKSILNNKKPIIFNNIYIFSLIYRE